MKLLSERTQIQIAAPAEQIWSVLEDSSLLPQWAPMVKSTTGKTETTGTKRRCQVEWQGRADEVVERCVEAVPPRRIAWTMEEGGMKKLFSEIRFGFELTPGSDGNTILAMEAFYRPRHLLARLLYALVMRRMMSRLRGSLLGNLKALIEANRRAAA